MDIQKLNVQIRVSVTEILENANASKTMMGWLVKERFALTTVLVEEFVSLKKL
jgi:hypothetical protein